MTLYSGWLAVTLNPSFEIDFESKIYKEQNR